MINAAPPKDHIKRGSSHLKEKEPKLNLISAKELEKEIDGGSPVWVLITKETKDQLKLEPPMEVKEVLEEYKDVFPEDLPD